MGNRGLDWTNHKLRIDLEIEIFLVPFLLKWNDVVLNNIVHPLPSPHTQTGKKKLSFQRYLSPGLTKHWHVIPLHMPCIHAEKRRGEPCHASSSSLPTLPCAMTGVRWLSPPLIINTREGTIKNKGEHFEKKDRGNKKKWNKKKEKKEPERKEGKNEKTESNIGGGKIWEKEERKAKRKQTRGEIWKRGNMGEDFEKE